MKVKECISDYKRRRGRDLNVSDVIAVTKHVGGANGGNAAVCEASGEQFS